MSVTSTLRGGLTQLAAAARVLGVLTILLGLGAVRFRLALVWRLLFVVACVELIGKVECCEQFARQPAEGILV